MKTTLETFQVVPTTHKPLCLESSKNPVKETYMYNILTGLGVKESRADYIAYTSCEYEPQITISQLGGKLFDDMPIFSTFILLGAIYVLYKAITKIKITIK